MDIPKMVHDLALEAKAAARQVGNLSRSVKDRVILRVADLLEERRAVIQAENRRDVEAALAQNYPAAFIDRLTLSDKVIASMIKGLKEVAALPDPVGEVTGMWLRPNGLKVGRKRIPLGVIGFIYESRPNVTVDAAALCLKSGNAVILRGGKEAIHSNLALAGLMQEALDGSRGAPGGGAGHPQHRPGGHPGALEAGRTGGPHHSPGRRGPDPLRGGALPHPGAQALQGGLPHLRGRGRRPGDGRQRLLQRQGAAPRGLQRHGDHAGPRADRRRSFCPGWSARFREAKVEIRGCPRTREIVPGVVPAKEEDWGFEFLDLILAVKVVPDLDEALDHIARYGSNHTEAIITRDYGRAQRFLKEVDSSVVLVNASTRFNDGGELGLGAEIGINTSKLHAFGPMGLEELTTTKFIVYGDGQIRT